MNTEKKEKLKKEILNAIYERASFIEEELEKLRGILLPKNLSYSLIEDAALKFAIQEWKDNKIGIDHEIFYEIFPELIGE